MKIRELLHNVCGLAARKGRKAKHNDQARATDEMLDRIFENIKTFEKGLARMDARLCEARRTIELDFICGLWVRTHEILALTVRKTENGYRLVLYNRGKAAERFETEMQSDGKVVYRGDGGMSGRIYHERGNPFIVLEHHGIFYLHEADADAAPNPY